MIDSKKRAEVEKIVAKFADEINKLDLHYRIVICSRGTGSDVVEYHDFENIERFADIAHTIFNLKKESGASLKEILDLIEKTLVLVENDKS